MPERLSPSSRVRIFARPAYVTALATGSGLCLAGAPLAQAQNSAAAPAPMSAPTAAALPSFAPLVKRVLSAVVNISVNEKGAQDQTTAWNNGESGPGPNSGLLPGFPPSPFDQFLRHFFDQQRVGAPQRQRNEIALGSGFIIDPTPPLPAHRSISRRATNRG